MNNGTNYSGVWMTKCRLNKIFTCFKCQTLDLLMPEVNNFSVWVVIQQNASSYSWEVNLK